MKIWGLVFKCHISLEVRLVCFKSWISNFPFSLTEWCDKLIKMFFFIYFYHESFSKEQLRHWELKPLKKEIQPWLCCFHRSTSSLSPLISMRMSSSHLHCTLNASLQPATVTDIIMQPWHWRVHSLSLVFILFVTSGSLDKISPVCWFENRGQFCFRWVQTVEGFIHSFIQLSSPGRELETKTFTHNRDKNTKDSGRDTQKGFRW